MTDGMLQNRYCVAALQHRLSYNGSIATSPQPRGTRDETKDNGTTTPAPPAPIAVKNSTGRDRGRWPGQPDPLGLRLRGRLAECFTDHHVGDLRGYVEYGYRRGDPPGVQLGKRLGG
jgi:hypothetical protein